MEQHAPTSDEIENPKLIFNTNNKFSKQVDKPKLQCEGPQWDHDKLSVNRIRPPHQQNNVFSVFFVNDFKQNRAIRTFRIRMSQKRNRDRIPF